MNSSIVILLFAILIKLIVLLKLKLTTIKKEHLKVMANLQITISELLEEQKCLCAKTHLAEQFQREYKIAQTVIQPW